MRLCHEVTNPAYRTGRAARNCAHSPAMLLADWAEIDRPGSCYPIRRCRKKSWDQRASTACGVPNRTRAPWSMSRKET